MKTGRVTLAMVLAGAMLAASAVSTAVAKEYGDLILDRTKESMEEAGVKPVLFPHWFHRIRFKCKVCHEQVFTMEQGANDFTMNDIMQGEACGVCHNGKIAWEPLYCDRCHSVDAQETGAKQ